MCKLEKDDMDRKIKLEQRWDDIVNDLGLDMRGQSGINYNKQADQT